MVYIGTADTDLDNHTIFAVRKSDEACEVKDFVLGTGTLLDAPMGRRREASEISFTTNCSMIALTTSHEIPGSLATTPPLDRGLSTLCDVERKQLPETTGPSGATKRWNVEVVQKRQASESQYTFLLKDNLKRLSLSSYLLDINIGPGASEIGLFNSADYYSSVSSQTRLRFGNVYVHRYRIIIKHRVWEYWEQALTIILAALVGVGATALFEATVAWLPANRQ